MQTLLTAFRLSLLFTLAILYFNFTIYAQIDTPSPTATLTPTQTPTNTPTYTPMPTIKPTIPEGEPTETPEPEQPPEDTAYGPQVPQDFLQKQQQQQQQQQSSQGDVKSAFSPEDGPENILDNKPNDMTGNVIQIIVTVIALTFTGIIGWFAMKSNATIEVEEGSE